MKRICAFEMLSFIDTLPLWDLRAICGFGRRTDVSPGLMLHRVGDVVITDLGDFRGILCPSQRGWE
jgi:hypothetical protein